MQPFYPPPLNHHRVLVTLVLLVACLHLAGLGSLATVWPAHSSPELPVSVRLHQPSVEALSTSDLLNKSPAPQAKPRKHLPRTATPEGFHATASAVLDQPVAASSSSEEAAIPAAPAPSEAPALATPAPLAPPSAELTPPASTPAPVAAPDAVEPAVSVNPESLAAPWLAKAKFVFPAPLKLLYDVIGESKGIRYSADGELVWQHDSVNYKMSLDIRHVLMGSRSQNSIGELGVQGLLPKRFGDKYKQEVAAHFERDKGLVVFSASSTPQVLQAGAQDRLSLFVQLGALLAGTPELRQAGQQIPFQVVASKSADNWAFQVDKEELLNLPIGPLNTLKVSRLPLKNYDQTAEIWLSPAHGFLPVKVRIAQANGDVLEQQLRKVQAP